MTTYDFVHLTFLAMGGAVKGKTKLQKTVYFLGLLTGLIDELGYRPHYYGPYSSDVEEAVTRLRTLGFLCQRVVGGTLDSSGFEMARYDFALTEEGLQVARAKAAGNPDTWTAIRDGARKLQVRDLDYGRLSVAAKTYFMLKQKGDRASADDLAELAPRFGWSVASEQVRDAAEFLASLNLVELREKAS